MKYWFVSDTHFGHSNIIRYTNRPWLRDGDLDEKGNWISKEIAKERCKEMDEAMIKNWNERVKPEDQIFHLGDFCFKNSPGGKLGEGEQNTAKYYENKLNGKMILIQGNHDCFSMDTKILTPTGYKFYNELKVGDLIATVNLKKHKVEFQAIQKINNYQVLNSYIAKNKTMSGIFTENHKHLIVPFNKNSSKQKWDWKFKPSSSVWKSCYMNIPTTCPSILKNYPISDDYLSLFSWIHTDGGLSYHKNKIQSIIIYQSKVKNVNEILKLLKTLKIKYKHTIRNRKIKTICGRKLHSILPQQEFRINSKEARRLQKILQLDLNKFPLWISKLSDTQMYFVLCELIKGDGSYTSTNSIQLWGKKDILEKWMGLFVTHNIDCSLIRDKRRHYYLCVHSRKNKEFSTRQIVNKYLKIKSNKLTEVWGVTVKNHIIFVQKDGKPYITGNSSNSAKSIIQNMTIKHGGIRIFMTHDPKFARKDFKLNLCGHIHNHWKIKGNIYNVGVDVNNFMPVDINEILGYFKRGKYKRHNKGVK